MSRKKQIVVFCSGMVATEEEMHLLRSYPMFETVAVNAKMLTGTETFAGVDGVCGAVPEHLKHLPTADDAVKKLQAEISEVAKNVGGKAPSFGKK